MRTKATLAAAAVLLAAALAGCDTSSDPKADPAAAGSSPATAGSTATPSRAPSSSPPPSAADGANLDACRDGACQILVSGPATVPLDGSVLAELSVELKDGDVEFNATPRPGSTVGGSISAGCVAVIRVSGTGSGVSTLCGNVDTANTGGLVVRALTVAAGSAVVDITTSR
ncbi:MAG: hypothetical protein HOV68_33855 [Streptomycetaceae bacterium]|nr:hypothetical protein [Streptomycetaceae bacterium]